MTVTTWVPLAGLAAAAGADVGAAAAAGAVVAAGAAAGAAGAVVAAGAAGFGASVGLAAAGADVGAAGAEPPPLQAARIAEPEMPPSTSAVPRSIRRREYRGVTPFA